MDLAVLLFPTLNENFSVVDDLDSPVALPPFAEAEKMAGHENPELRVAMETLRSANLDVTAAKGAFLPAFFVDADYGIEANAFALHSVNVEDRGQRLAAEPGLFRHGRRERPGVGLGHACAASCTNRN